MFIYRPPSNPSPLSLTLLLRRNQRRRTRWAPSPPPPRALAASPIRAPRRRQWKVAHPSSPSLPHWRPSSLPHTVRRPALSNGVGSSSMAAAGSWMPVLAIPSPAASTPWRAAAFISGDGRSGSAHRPTARSGDSRGSGGARGPTVRSGGAPGSGSGWGRGARGGARGSLDGIVAGQPPLLSLMADGDDTRHPFFSLDALLPRRSAQWWLPRRPV
jgi:hypothetical protein